MMAWSSLAHSVGAMFEVSRSVMRVLCTFSRSSLCFIHCNHPDLNLANLEASSSEMNSGVSLFGNSTVARSFWWRQTYVIIAQCCASNDGTFKIIFTLNVRMNCARNYKNLLNFVIDMLKILVRETYTVNTQRMKRTARQSVQYT